MATAKIKALFAKGICVDCGKKIDWVKDGYVFGSHGLSCGPCAFPPKKD